MGKAKILGDIVEGGLGLMRGASKAEQATEGLTATERATAGRKAAELIKSQPQVKASEALGQAMEKGFKGAAAWFQVQFQEEQGHALKFAKYLQEQGVKVELAAIATPGFAQAPAWPTRPIKFIIPFGAGSATDVGARLMAGKLQPKFGKHIISI